MLFKQAKDSVTVLVSGVKFVKTKLELSRRFVQAHRELTDWILAHPEEAKKMVLEELSVETQAKVSAELIGQAWNRIGLRSDVSLEEFQQFVSNAQRAGFMRTTPDLARLIERLP